MALIRVLTSASGGGGTNLSDFEFFTFDWPANVQPSIALTKTGKTPIAFFMFNDSVVSPWWGLSNIYDDETHENTCWSFVGTSKNPNQSTPTSFSFDKQSNDTYKLNIQTYFGGTTYKFYGVVIYE